jgi:hypothetical protein
MASQYSDLRVPDAGYSRNTSCAPILICMFLNNIIKKNCWNELIWVTGHCNRAAVSRNRYGVEKTVDTHKILLNAIKFYVCLQEI